MTAWIHRIDTLLPDFSFAQEEAMVKMQEWARDDRERRLVRAVYRHSGIERRHSVLRNYDGEGEGAFFHRDADGASSRARYRRPQRHLFGGVPRDVGGVGPEGDRKLSRRRYPPT